MATLTELEVRHIVETVDEALLKLDEAEGWHVYVPVELIDDLKEILRMLGAEDEHDES